MDQIAVWLPVSSVVANNGMPFSVNQGFKLDAEFNNPISFPGVEVAVAVLAFIWIKIDQEFPLTHGVIIQQRDVRADML